MEYFDYMKYNQLTKTYKLDFGDEPTNENYLYEILSQINTVNEMEKDKIDELTCDQVTDIILFGHPDIFSERNNILIDELFKNLQNIWLNNFPIAL
jgi:hypothetical protein